MASKYGIFTVVRLCIYQINIQFRQGRTYVIWGILILYLDSLLAPLRDMAVAMDVGVPVWVFTVLINDYIFPYLMLSLAIILFCNAPFFNQMSMYIIGRSGKLPWVLGMMLYLFLSSGIFIIMVLVGIVICLVGRMELTLGWGECIRLQAYSEVPERFRLSFAINASLISNYDPMEAMLMTVLLCWMVIFLLLLIVFIGNYISNEFIGAGIALGLVLLDLTIVNLLGSRWFKVSPTSFMKLTILTGYGDHPSILYVLKTTPICILFLMFVMILAVVKTKGFTERDE